MKVVGCVGAHYELQDVQMARVYRWHPASITLECECGERTTLTSSRTSCVGCGADHTEVIVEVLEKRMEEGKGRHPYQSLRSYFNRPKPI